ncbi:MAG TPA: radical SAM protein [Candidatus Scatomorpha gallistercoris]|nr:radical SAM protein [Candidatus Scatomorpha gallistercoris]
MHFVRAKGLLSAANGMNIYRGCMHGCIYCDSHSACYHMEHAFEDVEVKENALELLEDALRRKRKKCMLATGYMTDPYIPLEDELRLVRGALSLAAKYGFGFTLCTKSARVLRDMDLLTEINRRAKCVVQMTLTTHDETLCRKLEPNVSTTRERFEALCTLRDAGIPTVVWLSPVLPFINDTQENIRGILDYCVEAGVRGVICFGIGVTLREGSRDYFYRQLDRLFPGMKERYTRAYGLRYELLSPDAPRLMGTVRDTCAKHGIMCEPDEVFRYLRTLETEDTQLSLFG